MTWAKNQAGPSPVLSWAIFSFSSSPKVHKSLKHKTLKTYLIQVTPVWKYQLYPAQNYCVCCPIFECRCLPFRMLATTCHQYVQMIPFARIKSLRRLHPCQHLIHSQFESRFCTCKAALSSHCHHAHADCHHVHEESKILLPRDSSADVWWRWSPALLLCRPLLDRTY